MTMGRIDPRLERVLGTVKQNATVGVFVTTRTADTQQAIQEARGVGATNIQDIPVADGYRAQVTPREARRLADLPSTGTVFYDEPATILQGGA